MALNKIDILNKMSKQIPEINEKVRKQQQAAQEIQLANQALAGGATEADIGNIETAAVQAEGASKLQAQDSTNKQLGAIDEQKTQVAGQQLEQGLQQTNINVEQQLGEYRLAATNEANAKGLEVNNNIFKATNDQELKMHQIEKQVGEGVLSERMQFEKTQLGNKMSNINQLADWTIGRSKDQNEWKVNFRKTELKMNAEVKNKELILKEIQNRQNNANKKALNARQLEFKKRLEEAAIAAKRQAEKSKAKTSMWISGVTGAAMIVGGVVLMPVSGGLSGGLVAAGVGQVGSAAGSASTAYGD